MASRYKCIHGRLFFDYCYCDPGFEGDRCDKRMSVANSYHTESCKNLRGNETYSLYFKDIQAPSTCLPNRSPFLCQLLCYHHPYHGISRVPRKMWEISNDFEEADWVAITPDRVDKVRAEQFVHVKNFDFFHALPHDLGDVLEVGSGPYPFLYSLVAVRSADVNCYLWGQIPCLPVIHSSREVGFHIKSTTFVEPNGRYYASLLGIFGIFPNEKFLDYYTVIHYEDMDTYGALGRMFDTVVAIDVLEHTVDAFDYLESVYGRVKPGGMLIWHERYFEDPLTASDCFRNDARHPIRVQLPLFRHFLSLFDLVYLNRKPAFAPGGQKCAGWYVIARRPFESELEERHPEDRHPRWWTDH